METTPFPENTVHFYSCMRYRLLHMEKEVITIEMHGGFQNRGASKEIHHDMASQWERSVPQDHCTFS